MTEELDNDFKKLRDEAEFHAFSVRQLTGQRTRLFEICKLASSILNSQAFDSRNIAGVLRSVEFSESEFHQDIFCLLLNAGKKDGFFVEFGACDGKLISNTALLESQFGWTGILSEPAKAWQDKISANRTATLETRCVWHETGSSVKFAEFANDDYKTQSGILDVSSSLLSVDNTYDVETVSLFDMLKHHNAPSHIDYISIDTEGSERAIITPFPFDQFTFGFISIEHKTSNEETRIKEILSAAGYKQVLRNVSGHDGFYIPSETADSLSL